MSAPVPRGDLLREIGVVEHRRDYERGRGCPKALERQAYRGHAGSSAFVLLWRWRLPPALVILLGGMSALVVGLTTG